MIKRICGNISVIVIVIILIFISYKIGQWRTWRPKEKAGTVFITDTLDYEIPDYVDKPGLFFRLTHESIPPRSKQPVTFKPWMDSIFTAINFIKNGTTVQTMMKRGTVVHNFTIDNVPDDYEFYGTPIGYNIIKKRFKNPFGWSGITIGTRIYYDRTVVPYLETGIRIKKFNFSIGVDKLSIYADVSYRIW